MSERLTVTDAEARAMRTALTRLARKEGRNPERDARRANQLARLVEAKRARQPREDGGAA